MNNKVPRLKPVGTWSVKPGYRAVRAAILRNCGRDGIHEALAKLVLVEIEVVGATSRPDLGKWHQEGSDQVPWDEIYTTLDRSFVIARMHDAPIGGDFAVSFFLHAFDHRTMFETPWGRCVLPSPQDRRPPHLAGRIYVYPD